jgi:hypothetical protein
LSDTNDAKKSWVSEVSSWQDMTKDIPRLVREDISKARLRPDETARGFKSLMHDPLAVQYAMGYKDRKYSLTYDVLKRIPHQLSIVGAIINTRVNQVSAFSGPFRSSKSVGFVIKHKDPTHLTSKSELKFIQDLEKFIYNCGAAEPNPHNTKKRDDFETFLKKIVRDSLIYDQCCFEIVPDRRGQPYEFMAVDASTMRIAASSSVYGPNETYHSRSPAYSGRLLQHLMDQERGPYRALQLYEKDPKVKPAYVQVVNGQIENVFTDEELAFGVRNPRTDIYIQGYGYGELEQLITIITSHLYAEEYNRRFFMQGSAPKGILNFKGDAMTPDMLEGFRRQWRASIEGVENSWKTPILQSEAGIDWIELNKSNKEMEYNAWIEYLIKVICAIFLMDPAELNFDLHGGVQQTPLFESSQEWKLKASRDRGLKPLLRFIAKQINEHIVSKIDDHFVFDFVGLDELTEQEKHTLRTEQVASYLTLNEVRRADDLGDLEHGDMPMNPTYLQAMQIKMSMEQQKQQQEQMQQQAAASQGGGEGAPNPMDTGRAQPTPEEPGPEYADRFTKSVRIDSKDGKFLEIDLDDWKGLVRDDDGVS